MAHEERGLKTAAELLAEWRAAGRDTVAARAAAHIAGLALDAATAANEAAKEVEAAAQAALEAVDRARLAATKAGAVAKQTAEAAAITLTQAEKDKARANHDIEVAEGAENEARDAFHEAEARTQRSQ